MRAEGWVTVDETGELSDLRWPDYGAAETTALRLCDELRARRLRHDPDVWAHQEVTAFVRGLAHEYAGYWKKGADDGAGSKRLTDEAVDILVSARVAIRVSGSGLQALPAAARYAAADQGRAAPTLGVSDESDDKADSEEDVP